MIQLKHILSTALAALALASASVFAAGGQVSVHLVDKQGKALPGAAVWLTGQGLTADQAVLKQSYKMGQKDRAFTPHLLIVPQQAEVSFPNYDSILHHVYSFSPAKSFEFKLYRDQPQALTFSATGAVELGCNIHDWMLGYILVVDSTHFAVTDQQGIARISLPKAELTDVVLKVWHEGFMDLDSPESNSLSRVKSGDKLNIQLNQALGMFQDDFSDEFDDYE
ncbi:methylamine utilization protein [Pseudoalteromonas rubra]|uniref:Methylamine utilization protein n=1 Tax=Pseudoalteromonas rubra TaxID=43658 RepID=A0A5S3WPQ4_9GAMM|nr:methylamine utilization protein [Pseudoalteromonas rubra]TMP29897.1 methylamine utilization protein [Pseudoalteromonas rubra]TMP32125.1 methylamine utilization protein [Pseudoalteromonas rubra]